MGLCFIACVSFLMGLVQLVEGKHLLKPYLDTHFAENYTPEKFESIEPGMTEEEVVSIIGKPLYRGKYYADSTLTNYYYTGDGKLLSRSSDNGQHGYDDLAWYRSTVTFSPKNIVVDIDKGWSHD